MNAICKYVWETEIGGFFYLTQKIKRHVQSWWKLALSFLVVLPTNDLDDILKSFNELFDSNYYQTNQDNLTI